MFLSGDGLRGLFFSLTGTSSCRLQANEMVSDVGSRDCNWDEAREGDRDEGSDVGGMDEGSDMGGWDEGSDVGGWEEGSGGMGEVGS